MKRYLTFLFLCMACACVSAQELTQNYLQTSTMLDADGSKRMEHIRYYDGLGRQFQEVLKNFPFTPADSSLITMQGYDQAGRLNVQSLPVPAKTNYLEPKDFLVKSINYYNDLNPHSMTTYEASALNRITRITAPGKDWQNHPKTVNYGSNGSSGNLYCVCYTVDDSGNLVKNSNYAAGRLLTEQTVDEDGHVNYAFTDMQGRMVLSRKLEGSTLHDTYYVYDDYGNLCYVLPPMINGDISTDNLNKYAYRYRYDYRNRCVEKKLPGAEPVTYIYDFANQLTFSQDGNQRTKHLYTVYQYDLHGRMVMQGEVAGTVNVSKRMISCIPVSQVSDTDLYQEFQGTNYASNLYSTIQLLPLTPEFKIINYYDNYDFTRLKGFKDFNYYYFQSDIPRNLLTGRMVANISNSSERNYELHIYNQKSELTGSWLQRFSGYNERINYTYSFTGKPKEKRCVYLTGKFGLLWEKMELKDVYTYEYDSKDRLANVYHKLNDRDSIKLAAYSYDVLGRLAAKTLHNSLTHAFYQNYKYDIHSWLTEINGSHFTQKLGYANTDNPCYNGNISRMEWSTREAEQYFFVLKKYNFIYDGMDRLKSATYSGAMPSLANQYNEEVTKYDKNGNILGLKRNGKTGTGSYGLIDDLTFTLNGNQLTAVNDAATATAYPSASEFKDGAKLTVEYAYDANGNLTKDLNKNITDIQYNCLNLPNRIIFADGSAISYLYSADGTKLRTTHKIGEITTTTDYCGNVILENNRASKLLTEEGYISLNDDKYHYYQKDHQGNIRVVVDQSGNTEEVNNYYPFGGIFESTGNVQTYKYNGKELDAEKGLNWYDYGARQYDAVLGRFTTMDPMAEKYYSTSSYAYCENNSVKFIDPDGKKKVIYNPDGTYKETTHNNLLHNTFVGRKEYIDYGNRKVQLSEQEFWDWQRTGNYGSIQPTDKVTDFEFYLDEPATGITDGIIKFVLSSGYSLVNSPKIMITGRTWSGTSQTSTEKIGSLIDVVSSYVPVSKMSKTGNPGSWYRFKNSNKHIPVSKKKSIYKAEVNKYKNKSNNFDLFEKINNYLIEPFSYISDNQKEEK